jgi:hypothetical protein
MFCGLEGIVLVCNLGSFCAVRGAVVIVWLLDLQLPMQSVPIITVTDASSNLDQGKVYNIM